MKVEIAEEEKKEENFVEPAAVVGQEINEELNFGQKHEEEEVKVAELSEAVVDAVEEEIAEVKP